MKSIGILSILIGLFTVLSASGQSIKGRVAASADAVNLGFANVNIYKNGKLVANVLTDETGNYNVKLDTGLYDCEIVYAGYRKEKKEIRVTSDEAADFSLSEDAGGKYSASEMRSCYAPTSYRSNISKGPGVVATSMWGVKTGKEASGTDDKATFGKLTAGEINDFSKWDMWTDLAEGELKENQKYWNFSPDGRYVVQVKDQNSMPLANAKVELLCDSGVVFTTRSDNTGKAELWESFVKEETKKNSSYSVRVTYMGQVKTKDRAKPVRKGVNGIEFNTMCDQPQNVDIAIVVDATSSMQDEIEYLKYDLNEVVFRSKEISTTLNFRFANIFYRDIGDAYVTEMQDFTSVLSESVAYTNRHNSGGGGDYEESVEIALDSAINKLNWKEDTRTRIVFLVLDAPPHNTPSISNKMKELCFKAAEKGIRIVPVTGSGTNKNSEYLMRCIALVTNGTYTFLTDHSALGYTHLKPSTDEYQVEVLNDLLVRVIKAYTYMPDCQQFIPEMGVNLPDSQVVVSELPDSSVSHDGVIDSLRNSAVTDSAMIEWSYYPNPTDGIIHIKTNKAIKELYISDLSGKALQVITNIEPGVEATADLSEYASGIYLIRYCHGKQWISGKIVLKRNY